MNKNAIINRIIEQIDDNNQNNINPQFNQNLDKVDEDNQNLNYKQLNNNPNNNNFYEKPFKGGFQNSENFYKNDNKSITEYMRKPNYRKEVFNTNPNNNDDDQQNRKYSNYMDNFNVKKKKNIDMDFNNSIYNVNKKKKKKNGRMCDSDDDEEEKREKEIGFKKSSELIKNEKRKYNNEYEDQKKYKNNNDNDDNSTSNYKKFVPPVKNICLNKDNEDNKSKDDSLKKFDKKLLNYIESEILNSSPNVKWDDIAGLDFAKTTIMEIIIWPLLRKDIFTGILTPPKGLLLFGPPGTGKTMIAKAIASESKAKFFNISASSLVSKWIGESEKLVRTLFALASYYQPSVIFIDEIDSLLTSRAENECEASRRIKTEFLVQLDGAGTNSEDSILIIGATNRPQEIDDAFIRRMSKRLYIPLPNYISRKQLIQNIIKRNKFPKYDINDEDLDNIVKKSKGYSGSDMMHVCKEASMMSIRSAGDKIGSIDANLLRPVVLEDFIQALKTVRPSVSEKTIGQYIKWNEDFGSFQFDIDEINN